MSASAQPRKDSASFFRNLGCPYFPCHEDIDPADFNCLFCYCPLYALGPRCGGNPTYTESGVKDCSACTVMHQGDAGVARVIARFGQLSELAKQPPDYEGLAPSEGRARA